MIAAMAAAVLIPMPVTALDAPSDSLPSLGAATISARVEAAQVNRCRAIARNNPVPLYGPWRVTCVDKIRVHGVVQKVDGVTIPENRIIALKTGMSTAKTRAIYAHELSHAWSIDRLTNRQRTWFANKLGYRGFWARTASPYAAPSEIWAASQARCLGYPNPNPRYRVTSCSLLRATAASPR